MGQFGASQSSEINFQQLGDESREESREGRLPTRALSIAHSACVPILMIAPMLHLTGLPVETLEQILLHLSGRDIVRIEAVRASMANSVPCSLDFVYVA